MKKEIRHQVYNKYNQRCAYCGKKLKYKDMQVDHISPKRSMIKDIDNINNLNPSCRRCNHYKRAHTLDQFRYIMATLHKRLQEPYINKVAIDYGIIELKPFDNKFYFEKL